MHYTDDRKGAARMVSSRPLYNQRRLTAQVCEAGQSIFFVMLALDVLQYLQHDVDRFADHCDDERQQGQRFQQRHWASPLCHQAPGRSAFTKKFLSRLAPESLHGMVQ